MQKYYEYKLEHIVYGPKLLYYSLLGYVGNEQKHCNKFTTTGYTHRQGIYFLSAPSKY